MTTKGGTLELIEIEALIENEPGCENEHTRPDNPVCSQSVTHRFARTCDGLSALFCANAAAANRRRMGRGVLCEDCERPAAECWQVIPV